MYINVNVAIDYCYFVTSTNTALYVFLGHILFFLKNNNNNNTAQNLVVQNNALVAQHYLEIFKQKECLSVAQKKKNV